MYEPETTVRVDSDAFPGTPLPPEEPTAENPPDGAILDYYLPAQAREIELRIFDGEHKLVRHVSSETASEIKHPSLPIAERWFPEPQRLETSAGMHRFIWNLAWGTSGVTESDQPDDGEGDIPRGPRVPPGKYTLELEVDGKKAALETLVVVKDPRSPASQAEMEDQFKISYKIFSDSLQARRALAEIGSVQDQLGKSIAKEAEANTELEKQVSDLTTAIDALLSGQSKSAEKAMGLEEANTALTAALHVSESSDRPIPSQALEVYGQAHMDSASRLQEWSALKQGPLANLNKKLKAQGLTPIAIAEIEREVYYLMTR